MQEGFAQKTLEDMGATTPVTSTENARPGRRAFLICSKDLTLVGGGRIHAASAGFYRGGLSGLLGRFVPFNRLWLAHQRML